MKLIFVSEAAEADFIDYLKSKGTVIVVPRDERFDPRISSHPDLVITIIDGTILIDQNAHKNIVRQLNALKVPYVIGDSKLSSEYPQDIAYNAVVTEEFLIHNLEFTDPLLFMHCMNQQKKLINVKQGYTKCSTTVVDDNSIITSDPGIYKATKDNMNTLLILPEQVVLEGFDHGFLGGASACFDDEIIFHGDLSKHSDYFNIMSFVEAANKKVTFFKEFPLTDIGSVLVCNHEENTSTGHEQKHVNIPIFISHEGCPNDCVFCNQRKITAKVEAMKLQEVSEQIENYCSTLDDSTYIELAFFGGSFTGIEEDLQEEYLRLAYEYKKAGKIQAIRLSTRPDYISVDILDRLKRYEVDIIELGVQSFHEEVLQASNRGHSVAHIYQAVSYIKAYGFQLGIQLMVGLPEDTKKRTVLSAKLAALLKPDFVRIYPTLVIKDTRLLHLAEQGSYHPLSLEQAVEWTKEMYQVFLTDHIPVIRIGLQPTDLIAEGREVVYGPFHPAFRQLVESAYFLDYIQYFVKENIDNKKEQTNIKIYCNPRDVSQVIGHKRSNLLELQKRYQNISIVQEAGILPMTVKLILE